MMQKWMVGIVVAGVLAAGTIPAAAAERWADKQVQQQGEAVKLSFEAWKKALEKANYDDAVIKNASGTIDVKAFLKAFEQDIDTFNDRFKSTRNGTTEVIALLRRASDVERRYQVQGGVGKAEWTKLGTDLGQLATAFRSPWPIASMDATAYRIGDAELAGHCGEVARLLGPVKDAADAASKKAAPADKAGREALKKEADALAAQAKTLQGNIKSGTAVATQIPQFLSNAATYVAKVKALALANPGATALDSTNRSLAAVAKAFGEAWASQ